MNLKHILICICIFLSLKSSSQELSIGGNIGFIPYNVSSIYSLGGSIEYRPDNYIISFNNDPFLLFNRDLYIFTDAYYLKLIVGDKLRFCPTFGGFIRSNSNYGLEFGLSIDYLVRDNFILFLKGDQYRDYFKGEVYSFYPGYEVPLTGRSHLVSFGIKKIIKK